MPKSEFVGDQEKADVKEELIVNKQIIEDNLTPEAEGGNWPDQITNLSEGATAIELLHQNQTVLVMAIIFMWKKINALERQLKNQD